MANYQELFRLPADLYQKGCPVVLSAAVLQKETESNTVFVQLKFKNISAVTLSSIKVNIRCYEPNGKEIDGINEFYYLDLNKEYGKSFGHKTPIVLSNDVCRKFEVCISEVVRTNGEVWTCDKYLTETLPDKVLIGEEFAGRPKLIQSYIELLRSGADYIATFEDDLFTCTCGANVLGKPENCPNCHRRSDVVLACTTVDGLIAKIKEKEDADKEKNYQQLITDFNRAVSDKGTSETKFRHLADAFTEFKDYKDGTEYIEKCNQKAIEIFIFSYRKNFEFKKKHNGLSKATCDKMIVSLITKKAGGYEEEVHKLKTEIETERDRLIAKSKKIKKIFAVSFASIVSVTAIVLLSIYVFIPMTKYYYATNKLEAKEFDKAITVFTEIKDYKDSAEMVKESKYQKAIALYKDKNYKESYEFFKKYGYKESMKYREKVAYKYGCELIADKKYESAIEVLVNADIKDKKVIDKTKEANYKAGKQALKEKKYSKAASYLEKGHGYNSDAKTLIKQAYYGAATEEFENDNFSDAIDYLKKAGDYKDSAEKIKEAYYKEGMNDLEDEKYDSAINRFIQAGDFKDSSIKIKEAKYSYVEDNYNNYDEKTFEYLNDLRAIGYKDTASKYNDLYSWKVKIKTCSTSSSDDDIVKSRVYSRTSYLSFNFELTGGTPGQKSTFTHSVKWPNGYVSKSDWDWEYQGDGDILNFYWPDGISSDSGDMVVSIYEKGTGKYIGGYTLYLYEY